MLINNFVEICTYAYVECNLSLPMQKVILNNFVSFHSSNQTLRWNHSVPCLFLQPNMEMEPFHSSGMEPRVHDIPFYLVLQPNTLQRQESLRESYIVKLLTDHGKLPAVSSLSHQIILLCNTFYEQGVTVVGAHICVFM
jgi:hypothetical protein